MPTKIKLSDVMELVNSRLYELRQMANVDSDIYKSGILDGLSVMLELKRDLIDLSYPQYAIRDSADAEPGLAMSESDSKTCL